MRSAWLEGAFLALVLGVIAAAAMRDAVGPVPSMALACGCVTAQGILLWIDWRERS